MKSIYCGTREKWSEIFSSHRVHLRYQMDDFVRNNLLGSATHRTFFYAQYQINDRNILPTNSRKSLAIRRYRSLYLHKHILAYTEYMPDKLTMTEGISTTRGSTIQLQILTQYLREIYWNILFSSDTRQNILHRYFNLKTKSLEPFLHTECFHIQFYDGPDTKAPPITMLYSRTNKWPKATGFVILLTVTLNPCSNYSVPVIEFISFHNIEPIAHAIKVTDAINMTLPAEDECATSGTKPVFCLYRLEANADMYIDVEVKSLTAEGINHAGCLYKGLALFDIEAKYQLAYSQATTEVLNPLWLVCDHTYHTGSQQPIVIPNRWVSKYSNTVLLFYDYGAPRGTFSVHLTVKSTECAGWFIYCGEVHHLAENGKYPTALFHRIIPRAPEPFSLTSYTFSFPARYPNATMVTSLFNHLNTRIENVVPRGKVRTIVGPSISLHCFILQYYNMYLHIPASECVMEIHPWTEVSQVYQVNSKRITEGGHDCNTTSVEDIDTIDSIRNISINPRCEVFSLTFQQLSKSLRPIPGKDIDTTLSMFEAVISFHSEHLNKVTVHEVVAKTGEFYFVNHYMSPSKRIQYKDYINKVTVELNASCHTATYQYVITYREPYKSNQILNDEYYFSPSYTYDESALASQNIYHFYRNPTFAFSQLIFGISSDKQQAGCRVIIKSALEKAPRIKRVNLIQNTIKRRTDVYYVLWEEKELSWKEASDKCQSIGSELPSISDSKDEDILQSILIGNRFEEGREDFHTPVPRLHTASLFIGLNMSKVGLFS